MQTFALRGIQRQVAAEAAARWKKRSVEKSLKCVDEKAKTESRKEKII